MKLKIDMLRQEMKKAAQKKAARGI